MSGISGGFCVPKGPLPITNAHFFSQSIRATTVLYLEKLVTKDPKISSSGCAYKLPLSSDISTVKFLALVSTSIVMV